VGVLVELLGEDGAHAGACGANHVLAEPIANKERVGSIDAEA
jgi:hypothetical protein